MVSTTEDLTGMLRAHGILPTNDYWVSLLDRNADVTAVAAVVALISLGYLALLCRDVYQSLVNLFDVYNMALAESEAVRQEHPQSRRERHSSLRPYIASP